MWQSLFAQSNASAGIDLPMSDRFPGLWKAMFPNAAGGGGGGGSGRGGGGGGGGGGHVTHTGTVPARLRARPSPPQPTLRPPPAPTPPTLAPVPVPSAYACSDAGACVQVHTLTAGSFRDARDCIGHCTPLAQLQPQLVLPTGTGVDVGMGVGGSVAVQHGQAVASASGPCTDVCPSDRRPCKVVLWGLPYCSRRGRGRRGETTVDTDTEVEGGACPLGATDCHPKAQ